MKIHNTILLTNALNPIGKEITKSILNKKIVHNLILTSNNRKEGLDYISFLKRKYNQDNRIFYIYLDTENITTINLLLNNISNSFTNIDILINNPLSNTIIESKENIVIRNFSNSFFNPIFLTNLMMRKGLISKKIIHLSSIINDNHLSCFDNKALYSDFYRQNINPIESINGLFKLYLNYLGNIEKNDGENLNLINFNKENFVLSKILINEYIRIYKSKCLFQINSLGLDDNLSDDICFNESLENKLHTFIREDVNLEISGLIL